MITRVPITVSNPDSARSLPAALGPDASGQADLSQVARVRVGRVAHEAVRDGTGQLAGPSLHATEVDGWNGHRRVGSRVEVGLQPGEAVVRALVGRRLARGERGEGGADCADVVARRPMGSVPKGTGSRSSMFWRIWVPSPSSKRPSLSCEMSQAA